MENFQFIGIDVSVLNPTNDPAVDGSDDDSARVAQQSVFFFFFHFWHMRKIFSDFCQLLIEAMPSVETRQVASLPNKMFITQKVSSRNNHYLFKLTVTKM